jgi:predicted  nucleic acid-binding Zn-ribbon protein
MAEDRPAEPESEPEQDEIFYPEPLDLEAADIDDPDGRAAWILLETYRWTVLHGEAPYDQVWDSREGYPSTRDVVEVFGSWENLWELAGLWDSYHLRALDAADEEYEQVLQERKKLREDRQKAQREASRARKEAERLEDRLREMRRQTDKAKAKAGEATDALTAERARAERAVRRAEEAERRVAADAAAPAPSPPADTSELEARQAELLEELEGAERFADALTEELHEVHDRVAEREREIAELRRALGRAPADGDAAEGEPPPEPATVLEAVQTAAAQLPHLVFAPRAYESAADSPFARPGLILENLWRLDELAARYLEGDIGEKVSDLAFRLGLNWRGGISERTRTRYGKEYAFTFDGRTFELGPHVRIGSGQGAGAIARIYLVLHPGDAELPRSVIVGHVGRHLPDSTT